MKKCKHCHKNIEIRNPSGYCDHLYYPDNCLTCKGILRAEQKTTQPMGSLKKKSLR